MTLDRHTLHKGKINVLRSALYDFAPDKAKDALNELCRENCLFRLCHPFGDMHGADDFYSKALLPLAKALPDLERRDYIVIAGEESNGTDWVGCAGYYTGVLVSPWLSIPPTGQQVSMRFHEFYRFEDGEVVEFQGIWDIPELMMQAGAWPMAPSLGREWLVPAPATQDGIYMGADDAKCGDASCRLVIEMLEHMTRHPVKGGPDVMQMKRFWHPRMNWYGPAGIGTCRGFSGFRNWHQIPFLNAMPDRGQHAEGSSHHFFGERNYVGVTGWPNMKQTHSGGGWLATAPSNKLLALRSLDFWRIENDLIRENWVLVDLIHAFSQMGIDVFERLKEFNKARNLSGINIPCDV